MKDGSGSSADGGLHPSVAEKPPEEAELVTRLRRGEEAAYEQLVRSYGGRMLAVARRMLGDEDLARDAVQDAFLSAFRAIGRFEGQSRISTWLHRIVVNSALMKLRSRRRRPETSIDELLPGFLEDGHLADPPAPWREDAVRELSRRESRALVRERIAMLPEAYRNVLILRDIEELDTAEVAELLGVSTGAVKTRLHRARLALRKLLDPELREEVA